MSGGRRCAELRGGAVTFATMSYIVFVQPAVLSQAAGMDFGAVLTATCLSAALATLRAMLADAVGTLAGAALGTSTVSSYIESASGVAEGARTGLANVRTAALFLGALFFAPVVAMVGGGVRRPCWWPPMPCSRGCVTSVERGASLTRRDPGRSLRR